MDIRILNIDSRYNITPHNREALLSIAQWIHVWDPNTTVVLVSKEMMDRLFPPSKNLRLDLKEVKIVLGEKEFSSEQFLNQVRVDFRRSMEEATDFWRKIKCTVTSVYMAAHRSDINDIYPYMLNGMAVRVPFADQIGDPNRLETNLEKASKVTCEDLHLNLYVSVK